MEQLRLETERMDEERRGRGEREKQGGAKREGE